MEKFKLSDNFVEQYKNKSVDWGFNGLGYFVYKRTYARNILDDNNNIVRTEQWYQTIRRVVEGSFSYQKKHCKDLGLPWNNIKAQKSAQIMYDKMFNFKFLPPGRGLWIAGTQYIDKHGSMAMNNCGFVSTQNIDLKSTQPFEWTMNALMLGVGCLHPDTLVKTKDGFKKISQVNIGDSVISFNEETFQFQLKQVLNVLQNNTEKSNKVVICLENDEKITCTIDHEFLTNKGWVQAQYLTDKHELIEY